MKGLKILDVCCGPRFMWFDKSNENAIFMDMRLEPRGFVKSRPKAEIRPDILANFTNIPFLDNSFNLVVMDPPHIIDRGPPFFRIDMTKKYGYLEADSWFLDIRIGVDECLRVLKSGGFLIFKWNETSITKKDVLIAINKTPLFGHPMFSKVPTHWFCFMKDV